jgi:hypothetical protein
MSSLSILVNIFLAFAVFTVHGDPSGALTCGTGLQVCNDVTIGPVCYNSSIASCVPNSLGQVLCGFQEHGPDGACGTICYDMVDYICCNNAIFGVNDTTHPCINNPASSCPPLGSAPTAAPYCPAPNQICNDVTMGPTCYDPTIYSCPTGSCGTVLCGFQEHGPDGACGTICYDMVDYVCCNNAIYGVNDTNHPCSSSNPSPSGCPASGSAPTAIPNCPSENQICNDVTLGPTCYDPTIYSCVSGSCGLVLCGFQEHGPDGACGTVCYDMVEYLCCDNQLWDASDPASAQACGATAAPTSAPLTPSSAPTSSPTSSAGGPTNPDNSDNPNGPDNSDNPNGPDNSDNPNGLDNSDNPNGPDNSNNPNGPDHADNPNGPDNQDNPNH